MFTKKTKNIFTLTISIILFSLVFKTEIFGAEKLDLSQQKIISKSGDYYFKIPVSWENYVYASRASTDGRTYFDRIDFYYSAKDESNKDTKFLTLYSYYIKEYVNYSGQTVILANDKYVFTVTTAEDNPYTTIFDNIVFARILIEIDTANFISSKINISEENTVLVQSGTLTVNNQDVSIKPITADGEIYLPLRATAEKLGYEVVWVSRTRNIILNKDSKSITISTTSTPKLINRNDRIYLPIKYFMQKLNVSVDIDENNNIKIIG